jgi:hypothetical protein
MVNAGDLETKRATLDEIVLAFHKRGIPGSRSALSLQQQREAAGGHIADCRTS